MNNKKILIPITIILIIILISFIYTTVPRLELNGKQNMTLSYRDKYQEPGVIVKNANTNYLSKVKIENNINNDNIGNYYVDYSLKIGTSNLHVRRNVKIIDDIAPVIKLKGNQIIELSLNEEYQEPGFTAIDEYDGDITEKVETEGEINTKKYGEYILKYSVKDSSNNPTEVNRIIKVIDEMPPAIICESEYSSFKINSENIIGCNANDNFDGNITDKIKVSGEYDTNKKGIYNVEYIVEDDSGNKTKTNHKIVIFEELENNDAYIITTDTKNTLEVLDENDIKSTVINQSHDNNEYLEKLKEKGSEIGININGKIYRNINEFEEYCEDNNIDYYEINKNIKEEDIQKIISKLNNKVIIVFTDTNSTKELKTFIQILKEMNYSFKTLNNIK